MFFPAIIDKITTYSNHWPLNRATTCEILQIESVSIAHNSINATTAAPCSETMEMSTFGYSTGLEILYMLSFLIITLIINRVTKLTIMTSIIFTCGAAGFALQFIVVPTLAIYAYMVFLCTFIADIVMNSVIIDLYPTHLRWVWWIFHSFELYCIQFIIWNLSSHDFARVACCVCNV